MTPVDAACDELRTLTPMLAPALRRDNTGSGRYGRLEHGLSLVNTDVLTVMITLRYEIPAAAMRSAELTREPWQRRTISACLLALPRFAGRMQTLGLAVQARQLEDVTRGWVRQTKRALGLRTPELPLHAQCPVCDTLPAGWLYMAGSEAYVNPRDLTAPPRWEHDPRVYCTTCGETWQQGEWGLLERLIAQHAQHAGNQTPLPQQPTRVP